MVSKEFGCWEHSPFHRLALGTASPLGFTSPPFFAPISRYLISSLQNAPYAFLQISLQSLSLASSSSSTVLSEPICTV